MNILDQKNLRWIILAFVIAYIAGFIVKTGFFMIFDFILAIALALSITLLIATKLENKPLLPALLSVMLFFFLSFGVLILSQLISPCEDMGCTFIMVMWAFYTFIVSALLFTFFIAFARKIEAKNLLFSETTVTAIKAALFIAFLIFLVFALIMTQVWKPLIISAAKAFNSPSLCMSFLFTSSSAAKLACVAEVGVANLGNNDVAFNILIANINSPDISARFKAIDGLGDLKNEKALPYLEQIAQTEEGVYKTAAEVGIAKITGTEITKPSYNCTQWPNEENGVCRDSCFYYEFEAERGDCDKGICCRTNKMLCETGDGMWILQCKGACDSNEELNEAFYCVNQNEVCCVKQRD